jgi:competence protein ComFC
LFTCRTSSELFNQSKYIADGIAKKINTKVRSNILRRVKYTETQTNLSLTEREKNIENAFKVRYKRTIKNKSFLLVDDVITTGATLRECGKVLLNEVAARVYACSAAIAE